MSGEREAARAVREAADKLIDAMNTAHKLGINFELSLGFDMTVGRWSMQMAAFTKTPLKLDN